MGSVLPAGLNSSITNSTVFQNATLVPSGPGVGELIGNGAVWTLKSARNVVLSPVTRGLESGFGGFLSTIFSASIAGLGIVRGPRAMLTGLGAPGCAGAGKIFLGTAATIAGAAELVQWHKQSDQAWNAESNDIDHMMVKAGEAGRAFIALGTGVVGAAMTAKALNGPGVPRYIAAGAAALAGGFLADKFLFSPRRMNTLDAAEAKKAEEAAALTEVARPKPWLPFGVVVKLAAGIGTVLKLRSTGFNPNIAGIAGALVAVVPMMIDFSKERVMTLGAMVLSGLVANQALSRVRHPRWTSLGVAVATMGAVGAWNKPDEATIEAEEALQRELEERGYQRVEVTPEVPFSLGQVAGDMVSAIVTTPHAQIGTVASIFLAYSAHATGRLQRMRAFFGF